MLKPLPTSLRYPMLQAVNGESGELAATENLEAAGKLLAELAPEDNSGAAAEDERI